MKLSTNKWMKWFKSCLSLQLKIMFPCLFGAKAFICENKIMAGNYDLYVEY